MSRWSAHFEFFECERDEGVVGDLVQIKIFDVDNEFGGQRPCPEGIICSVGQGSDIC